MVCRNVGRHIHIEFCRSATEEQDACKGAGLLHVHSEIAPNPERPKDFVSHSLYWARLGMCNFVSATRSSSDLD